MESTRRTFDEFSREHLPGLLRFAAVLTGDRELAQDLVQDALVRAHRHWGRVVSADRPDLYLRRMVVNGHLSWRKRWYQRSVRPTADYAGAEPSSGDPTATIADREQLVVLLRKLTPAQHAAIVLRFYEDRDDTEIAEAMGCATGTVRSHISRGLAVLRLHLESDLAEVSES
ncbi:SigE family RNA polymerase sigma factor [Amycolatopsis sp. cmx-11-51]|uniref:SigE family RNA polymerase sigma factor n=1 Tax=unclassified Amycolatopsis TaxID=2618356 RepID=UPI0039E63836